MEFESGMARPPIGVTSMSFWNCRVEEAVARAAHAGYDAIEIWAEHLWRDTEQPAQVRQALQRAGIRCTMHCPIMDINIASPNRGARAEALRQFLQCVELTDALDAELLVTHPGALYSRHDPLGEFWAAQEEALGAIISSAERYGVWIAFENMDTHNAREVVKTPADIRRALAPFNTPRLGVTWDTTHLITTQANLDFVSQVDRIIHVHLSDAVIEADGRIRTHLPLGEGKLDHLRMLAALLPRFHGIVSLEAFIPASDDQTRIVAQQARVAALLDEAMALARRDQDAGPR